jgi:hypothetical protein
MCNLRMYLMLVLLVAASACDQGARDGPGDTGPDTPLDTVSAVIDTLAGVDSIAAADLACTECEVALEACFDDAQDGAMLNACLGAFARCHVAATGRAVACPDPERCGSCVYETDDPDELIEISQCILVVANAPEAARCGG